MKNKLSALEQKSVFLKFIPYRDCWEKYTNYTISEIEKCKYGQIDSDSEIDKTKNKKPM